MNASLKSFETLNVTQRIPPSFRRRSLNRAVRHALLCCSLTGLLTTQAQAADPMQIDIQAGSLDSALTQLSRSLGVNIVFDQQLLAGKRSAGLHGRFTADQALDKLIQASGLDAVKQGEGFVLQPMAARGTLDLAPTQIDSNQLGNITEGTGSYTPGLIGTATRLVLSPRQTPQSVTVVTRQHMDDFALDSVDDVMRHTPGITVSAYDSDRSNYYARGFSINNFQYDGIPSAVRNVGYSAGNTLSDMAIYDRIEVLKGSPGLLVGAGSLGATINLIRKKPTADFQGHLSLGAGSWDNYRSEIDVSGPLTPTGNVRGRAVAAYQDKHSFMDRYSSKAEVYYGILEFDLSPDTLLTVGGDYQDNTPKGSTWSGSFPLLNAEGDRNSVKRSFSNAADWSSWHQYTRTVFATLEHQLGDGWVSKLQLDHKLNGYDAQMGTIQGDTPAADGTSKITPGRYRGETTSDSADAYVTGPFNLLGREHEVVLGGSISKAHWEGKGFWDVTFPSGNQLNFFNWHGNVGKPDWGTAQQLSDDVIRQTGVYLATRLSATDDLHFILGGRIVNYTLTGNTDTYRESGRLIPYAGAVYDLTENLSAYASYTDIFIPQDYYNLDRNRKLLDPDEGQNYEVGIKGEFFDGRLNASLAYFQVKESNRPVADDDYNNQRPEPSNYAFKGTDAQTKGFELEVSGELAQGWQLQAGYTHKVVRDDNHEKISTFEPEDQLTLFTTYKLPGALDQWTVGGGGRWQSKAWQDIWNAPYGEYEAFNQKQYWVVDLMTKYQITPALSATVNLNNVFDKYYYTNIGFYNSAVYGEPRNVMVTTRWDF
ncbi:TonB-dependent siderophore receptor [Paucimonas lemoignei]|nr:TonB-dependent siderophore receptor [Paucimonas lemoignei]